VKPQSRSLHHRPEKPCQTATVQSARPRVLASAALIERLAKLCLPASLGAGLGSSPCAARSDDSSLMCWRQRARRISKAGAAFRSIGDPLWDTSSSQGRLLSTLLAAIAEFERDLIKERTGEGRKRAMANGVKFGRKPKLSEYQRKEAIKRRAAGETLAEIAKSYAVDISMISRLS
jgi:hypothetical protein